MKTDNKLPKYAIGTRMAKSLGYQQPNYVGSQQFSSTPGKDLQPEINTIKSNIIPNGLNKLTSGSQFVLDFLKSGVPAATSTTINTGSPVWGSIPTAGSKMTGDLASQFGTGTTKYATTAFDTSGSAAEKVVENTAGGAAKTGINTLGAVMGGIGTVYGLADMGMQLAHNKDHRSAGEMRDYMTTNTYTTDLGNTYTLKSGLDAGAELDYASKQKTAKNVNFTTSAIGTGLSAGTLLSALGVGSSILGPIGAGIGLVGGLMALGLGLGDSEEDTKQAIKDVGDSVAMENRMSESLARNADTKQGFYNNKSKAAKGKLPVYTNGKINARVSNGEIQGNLEEGWAFQYPGKPNNRDEIKTHVGKKDYIISNKYVPYVKSTGDVIGALAMQDMDNNNKNSFKCGKLPKYYGGTPLQTILASAPHLGALLSNWGEYNRLKNSNTSTPVEEISDLGANNVASEMMADQIDYRPYLNDMMKMYRQAGYDSRNQIGLGVGGRMVQQSDLFNKMLAQRGSIIDKINEINRGQRNAAREMRFKNYLNMQNLKHDSWWKREVENMQKQGSLNNLMAQIPANIYNIGSSWANNVSSILQHKAAMDIAERNADIYDKKVSNDAEIAKIRAKYLNDLPIG